MSQHVSRVGRYSRAASPIIFLRKAFGFGVCATGWILGKRQLPVDSRRLSTGTENRISPGSTAPTNRRSSLFIPP